MKSIIPARNTWVILRRLALSTLLAWIIISPLVQLHEVAHIIPSSWSDLYPQWIAVKAALHARDPYSLAITQEIQRGFYGHVLAPTENWDQQNFVYPAHLIFLLGPFTLLKWPIVRLLFTILAVPTVAASVWLWIRICGLRLDRSQMAIIFALMLTSWPAIWAYKQQQPTIYISAILAFAVFLYQRRSDISAGILFSLATVKPNLAVLLLAWILIMAAAHRRWRFVVAFGASISVLLVASEEVVPGWISHWLRVISAYSSDPRKVSTLMHLFGHSLGIAALVALILGLCMCLFRFGAPPAMSSEFGDAVALLLAVTVCVIPTTSWMVYNQILLFPAVLVLLRAYPSQAWDRSMRRLAFSALGWVLLAVPICATLAMLLGYRQILALIPFHDLLVPPILTVVLFQAIRRNQSQANAQGCEASFEPAISST